MRIDYLHLRGVEFIELVAGHADISFPGALQADCVVPVPKSGVLRMQRITPPTAGSDGNARVVQIGNDLIFHLFW